MVLFDPSDIFDKFTVRSQTFSGFTNGDVIADVNVRRVGLLFSLNINDASDVLVAPIDMGANFGITLSTAQRGVYISYDKHLALTQLAWVVSSAFGGETVRVTELIYRPDYGSMENVL